MDLNALKKINTNPNPYTIQKEDQPEGQVQEEVQQEEQVQEPVVPEMKCFVTSPPVDKDNESLILAEVISLTELIRRKMIEDETAKQEMITKLLASETEKEQMKEKLNKTFSEMKREIKELKEREIQKIKELETISRTANGEARQTQEIYQTFTNQLLQLIREVQKLKGQTWQEKAKTYGLNLLITVGTIALTLGVYRAGTLLVDWAKH